MNVLINNFSGKLFAFIICIELSIISCSDWQLNVKPSTFSVNTVTATTATINGKLNVADSELSFAQVIVCFSDDETFNINTARKVSVTTFDSDMSYNVTLNNLKYNTKYNYCVIVEIKSEKTYSDILSFTTSNITLDNIEATAHFTNAEITGKVSGVSTEEKDLITIGLICSTDSSRVGNREGEIFYADKITSEGGFCIPLNGLSYETPYHYCCYIFISQKYSYSNISKFSTLPHPYNIHQDLDIKHATDLSSSESANCYIISNTGRYKFKAVKGNSEESVGSVTSASILWETFGTSTTPEFNDLIKAVCYKDGYIVFHTADSYKKGNAVIAAKDVSGNILWSWHIWFTDQPQCQVYYNDAGTMMDRNLGATSATPGDVAALGLLYQWGRKDPIVGSSSIKSSTRAASTITWPSAVPSKANGTIAYANANPTTFISPNRNNYDWYYTDSEDTDNTRWTESHVRKSIYDPCPAGWRVPNGGDNGIWKKASDSNKEFTYTYCTSNNGINFSGKFGSSLIWYPAAGYYSGNNHSGVGYEGYYWSASPILYYAHRLSFHGNNYVYPLSYYTRDFGCSVRCCQDSIIE